MFTFFFLLTASVLISSCAGDAPGGTLDADAALEYSMEQLKATVKAVDDPSRFPRTTEPDNSWKTTGHGSWTSGFFPGLLVYAYHNTGDAYWKEQAERWMEELKPQQFDSTHHDTGFQIHCSFGNMYKITQDSALKEVIFNTCETLASRYNPEVKAIKSWDFMEGKYPVIIDNMMNLEMLFWAAKNGGKQEWYDLAVNHALTTMKNQLREDGGTWHVVRYDVENGGIERKMTHQGYSDESTWARGQAWGIYGFTMAYRETGRDEFLRTAITLADYFIAHLPEDYVPHWDFDAPDPEEGEKKRDTSAGAIAASAMLELHDYTKQMKTEYNYHDVAVKILTSLSQPPYNTKGTDNPAILLHASGNLPKASEVDVPLIYGDYYFVEGLLRYQDRGLTID